MYVTKTTGSHCLCRLERQRVTSLSLPLQTRELPNGDEVAVRSNAVVVRLNLSEDVVLLGDVAGAREGREISREGGEGRGRGRGSPGALAAAAVDW